MGYHVQATDNTLIFRKCVKTIRTRNRARLEGPERPRVEHRQDSITVKARNIVTEVTKLGAVILDTQAAYLNVSGLNAGAPQMLDAERNRLDSIVPHLATAANNKIKELEMSLSKFQVPDQHREHQKAVIKSLRDYLRHVLALHVNMRTARIAKAKEAIDTFRLDARVKTLMTQPTEDTEEKQPLAWTPEGELADEEILTPEELQVFEEENEALQVELEKVDKEINQLEGTVEDIAQLQTVFTEKILEQERDIDLISSSVIGTTESMKDANEQLRQAIQRNAGFRVYILFFLIVMSFSLLFLDWYNP